MGLWRTGSKNQRIQRHLDKAITMWFCKVTLKEKMFGTGSGNLTELESVINKRAAKGYRLHTIDTANGGSKGFGGGDRIQATMVF